MLGERTTTVALPRIERSVTALLGVLAALLDCAFLLQGLTRSALPWTDSFVSELESPSQPDSGFFRWTSLLAGVAMMSFAVGLFRRLPRGRLALAGCSSLVAYGAFDVTAALVPMTCTPSVDRVCRRLDDQGQLEVTHQLHGAVSVLAVVAVLASMGLLGLHLRRRPPWRRVGVVGLVGCLALSLWSVVVSVMSSAYLPGFGVAQRIQLLGMGAWLVLLAVASWRRPRH